MKVLGRRRGAALGTFAVTAIEEIAMLGLPALIGVAIDGLARSDHSGVVVLVCGIVALLAVGATRRLIDTRVFAGAEFDLALQNAWQFGPVGLRVGRLRQIHEMMQVFERNAPDAIAAVVGGLGSLIVLAIYDMRIAVLTLLAGGLLLGLNAVYAARVRRLNARINDRVERDTEVILANDNQALRTHLDQLRRDRIRRSDAEIATYALNWVILSGLIVISLLLAVGAGASAGATFAIMTYVFQFAESWNNGPVLVERWAHYRDVSGRLIRSDN